MLQEQTMEAAASDAALPARYAAQLREQGFLVLERALDLKAVARVRAAVASFFRRFEDEVVAGRRNAAEAELYRLYGNLGLGSIIDDGFAGAEEILPSIDDSIIARVVAEYFADRVSIMRNHVLARRYRARDGYANVVPFHQDVNAVDPRASVTSWIPLVRCGRKAPGLEVVGRRVSEILPIDPQSLHHRGSEIAAGDIVGRYPLVHPEFFPGDAILFLNTTPHRSHVTAGMTETRLSFELRYLPDGLLTDADEPSGLYSLRPA